MTTVVAGFMALATIFEGKVYPIRTKKATKVSAKIMKRLIAYYQAEGHEHGAACVADQILQEGFKETKSNR